MKREKAIKKFRLSRAAAAAAVDNFFTRLQPRP
jgi:hypothetical protein